MAYQRRNWFADPPAPSSLQSTETPGHLVPAVRGPVVPGTNYTPRNWFGESVHVTTPETLRAGQETMGNSYIAKAKTPSPTPRPASDDYERIGSELYGPWPEKRNLRQAITQGHSVLSRVFTDPKELQRANSAYEMYLIYKGESPGWKMELDNMLARRFNVPTPAERAAGQPRPSGIQRFGQSAGEALSFGLAPATAPPPVTMGEFAASSLGSAAGMVPWTILSEMTLGAGAVKGASTLGRLGMQGLKRIAPTIASGLAGSPVALALGKVALGTARAAGTGAGMGILQQGANVIGDVQQGEPVGQALKENLGTAEAWKSIGEQAGSWAAYGPAFAAVEGVGGAIGRRLPEPVQAGLSRVAGTPVIGPVARGIATGVPAAGLVSVGEEAARGATTPDYDWSQFGQNVAGPAGENMMSQLSAAVAFGVAQGLGIKAPAGRSSRPSSAQPVDPSVQPVTAPPEPAKPVVGTPNLTGGISPEQFAQLKPGDMVTLKSDAPGGLKGVVRWRLGNQAVVETDQGMLIQEPSGIESIGTPVPEPVVKAPETVEPIVTPPEAPKPVPEAPSAVPEHPVTQVPVAEKPAVPVAVEPVPPTETYGKDLSEGVPVRVRPAKSRTMPDKWALYVDALGVTHGNVGTYEEIKVRADRENVRLAREAAPPQSEPIATVESETIPADTLAKPVRSEMPVVPPVAAAVLSETVPPSEAHVPDPLSPQTAMSLQEAIEQPASFYRDLGTTARLPETKNVDADVPAATGRLDELQREIARLNGEIGERSDRAHRARSQTQRNKHFDEAHFLDKERQQLQTESDSINATHTKEVLAKLADAPEFSPTQREVLIAVHRELAGRDLYDPDKYRVPLQTEITDLAVAHGVPRVVVDTIAETAALNWVPSRLSQGGMNLERLAMPLEALWNETLNSHSVAVEARIAMAYAAERVQDMTLPDGISPKDVFQTVHQSVVSGRRFVSDSTPLREIVAAQVKAPDLVGTLGEHVPHKYSTEWNSPMQVTSPEKLSDVTRRARLDNIVRQIFLDEAPLSYDFAAFATAAQKHETALNANLAEEARIRRTEELEPYQPETRKSLSRVFALQNAFYTGKVNGQEAYSDGFAVFVISLPAEKVADLAAKAAKTGSPPMQVVVDKALKTAHTSLSEPVGMSPDGKEKIVYFVHPADNSLLGINKRYYDFVRGQGWTLKIWDAEKDFTAGAVAFDKAGQVKGIVLPMRLDKKLGEGLFLPGQKPQYTRTDPPPPRIEDFRIESRRSLSADIPSVSAEVPRSAAVKTLDAGDMVAVDTLVAELRGANIGFDAPPDTVRKLQKLGTTVVPGLRLQDAEEAGRTYIVFQSGKTTSERWTQYVDQLKVENRVRPKEIKSPQPVSEVADAVEGFKIGDRVTNDYVTGQIIGEGTLGKRKDPIWKLRLSDGAGEWILKEDKGFRLVPSLESVESGLGREVDEIIGDVTPAIGGSLRFTKGPKKPVVNDFAWSDPTLEEGYQAAKGVRKTPFWEQVREFTTAIWNMSTREFEALPRTAEFAPIRYKLLELIKQKPIQSDRTLRLQQGITIAFNKQPALMNLFRRKVFLNDLAEESNRQVAEGRSDTQVRLFPGWTPEAVRREGPLLDAEVAKYPEIATALQRRTQVWDAIRSVYIDTAARVGMSVDKRFTREAYFRHQILEYAKSRGPLGTGKKLKTPAGRGFLEGRVGSELPYNTDYLQAEYEVMSQMLYDIELFKTLDFVNRKENVAPGLKAEAVLRSKSDPDNPVDWHTLIPEGSRVWQPRSGNQFFLADTIPARIARQLQEEGFATLLPKDVCQILAMGGKREEYVLKNEVADTLDKLVNPRDEHPYSRWLKGGMTGWKKWQLIWAKRWLKYNARNLSGDAEHTFVGNPSAFLKAPRAFRELYRVFFGDGAMTNEMRDFYHRGGFQSNLQAQEMGDINRLRMFETLERKRGTLGEIPAKIWQGYWKAARLTTDFRESILRYAAYLDYVQQMERNNGVPKNFGASIREEIMALDTIEDRAYVLSNQLLGAYDQVSMTGQYIRDHVAPFWSWKEINFKWYLQTAKNAFLDGKAAGGASKGLAFLAKASPMVAIRVGAFLVKSSAMWAMLQTFNHQIFAKEEEELPDNVQGRPHIIFGRREDGSVIYLDRLGSIGDFLEWFGVDSPKHLVRDYLNGRKSPMEVVKEMAKSPINVIAGSVGPIKTIGEFAFGTQIYPDVFESRPIKDRVLYLFQQFGLDDEYRALTGLPRKSYWDDTITNIVALAQDEGQGAYYDILDEKHEFQKKRGKRSSFSYGEASARTSALYNFKLAIRYRDKVAAEKYLAEYASFGGTQAGLNTSFRNLDPLFGLDDAEKAAFVNNWLDEETRKKLALAYTFYNEILLGKRKEGK